MKEVRLCSTENEKIAKDLLGTNANFIAVNMKENSIDSLIKKEKARKFNSEIEKYNEKAKVYEMQNSYFTDVNCTNCFGKFLTLEPNKSLNYRIDLSKLYLIEKALKEPKSKYRFSLHFDTIDLLKYSAFRKCYAESFTSEKIVYKTK